MILAPSTSEHLRRSGALQHPVVDGPADRAARGARPPTGGTERARGAPRRGREPPPGDHRGERDEPRQEPPPRRRPIDPGHRQLLPHLTRADARAHGYRGTPGVGRAGGPVLIGPEVPVPSGPKLPRAAAPHRPQGPAVRPGTLRGPMQAMLGPAGDGGPPSGARALLRGLARRRLRCGAGRLFRGWFHLRERCPRCGLRFEREEGGFLGALTLNHAMTAAAWLVVLVVGLVIAAPEVPAAPLMAASAAVVILVPLVSCPFAKATWAAVEYLASVPEEDAGEAPLPAGRAR